MLPVDQTRSLVVIAMAIGLLYGALYTASPLTALCLPILIASTSWVVRGQSERERRWVIALVALSIVLRLAAIATLYWTAGPDRPFASFFGDEEFFTNRATWRRNVGLGVPIHTADAIYLFDDLGYSSYLFILAFVQALVGEAPYGVHVLNMTCYVGGVLVAYRLVRNAYGGLPALLSMTTLLFWPSLFVWSISALKEPAYTCVAAFELWAAVAMLRGRAWRRAGAAALVVAGALVLDSLRRGGLAVAAGGAVVGATIAILVPRPRLILATAVAMPMVVIVALSVPAAQERALSFVRSGVSQHAGHVLSEGHFYKLVEPRYYFNTQLIHQMPAREAGMFFVKATASYFVEPLPWHAESLALRAYLPEQVAWLFLVACAAIGVIAGLRRDVTLTAMLVGHASLAVMIVALTSGNLGTLIRHRGLALPYIAWLAGIGFCEFIRVAVPTSDPARDGQTYGNG
jgi:hypothetical protein